MKKLAILALALMSTMLHAQAVRYNWNTFGTVSSIGPSPVRTLPGSIITVCNYPATYTPGSPCTNLATLYTDATGTIACLGVQVNGCSNPVTSDVDANFGFWALPGHYQYTVTYQGNTGLVPIDITLGGSGSSPPGSSNFNLVGSIPTPGTAGKPYLLTAGSFNFLLDNGTKVWNPSPCDTNGVAFGADNTGATDSVTYLQNAIHSVPTTAGQKLCIPSGVFLINSAPLHIDREMVVEGNGGAQDYPATTLQLGPGQYVVMDFLNTSSQSGARGDWSVLRNLQIKGTSITCSVSSGSLVLSSCSAPPATTLNLSSGSPIVAAVNTNSAWTLIFEQGATVSSMTSNSITLNAAALDGSAVSNLPGYTGSVTVMNAGNTYGTGTTANNSTLVTGISNCAGWAPGDPILGPGLSYYNISGGISFGNFVVGVNCTTNTLTLNYPATSAAGTGNLYKGPVPNLMVKSTPRVEDISIMYSAGDGILVNANAAYSPVTGADGFGFNYMRIAKTGGSAFHCNGGDCNAGVVVGLYAAYTGESCIRDDSFLGNTIIGGECANNYGPSYYTTNANASEVLVNPYLEGGNAAAQLSIQSLILGGASAGYAVGGNELLSNGVLSPSFNTQNYTESTGSFVTNSNVIQNVTNIGDWQVGDAINSWCLPGSTTVTAVGTTTLTTSAGAICNQYNESFSHTGVQFNLGSNGTFNDAGGWSVSANKSVYFSMYRKYLEYNAPNSWGWMCDTWRNSRFAFCESTDWANGKEMPPGPSGGYALFPNGFYIGMSSSSGANSFTLESSNSTPTVGSYSQGSWVWPDNPTVANGAVFVQIGAGKAISATATAVTGNTQLTSISTSFQNSCAAGDWITGIGLENDTAIQSVNPGAATAVLTRPPIAAGTLSLTCGRLAKAHPVVTGNVVSGSNQITSVNPINSFANGDSISGTGIPLNTYVLAGGGTATITTSQNATATNTGVTLGDPTISFLTVPFSTGNVSTASSLLNTPTICPTGQAPQGILANGNATGCASIGSGGSMTWPTGSAGIPNYNGLSAWGTTYNTSNLIPANFLQISLTTTGTSGAASYNTSTGVLNIPNYATLPATPTSPNGVPQTLICTPSSGSCTPTFGLSGIPINAQTGPYNVAVTDRGGLITENSSTAQSIVATNPSTSGFGNNFAYLLANIGTGLATETASGFQINGGTSLIIPNNWFAFHYSDNTNYRVGVFPSMAAFPSCLDSSGNHLNFNTTTGAFICGTSSSTAAAGSSGQLQYNAGGAFGGAVGTNVNSTTGQISITENQAPVLYNALPLFPSVTSGGGRFWGDSITCGSGASASWGQWDQLVGTAIGGIIQQNCTIGDQVSDTNWKYIYTNSNPAATFNGTDYVLIGTNDYVYYGTITTGEQIYSNIMASSLAWMTIPTAQKVFAQNSGVTKTGAGWSVDNTQASGYAEKDSTNGDSISFPITSYGGPIYLWVRWSDGNAGTGSVTIDSTSVGTVNAYGPQSIATHNGTTNAVAMYRYTGIAAGSHTVAVTVSSATGAGNVLYVVGVGTPQAPTYVSNPEPGAPRAFVGGVIHQQGGLNDSGTAIYDGLAQSAVAQENGDGLPVFFADARDAVGSTNFLNQLHPNELGHRSLANAFLNASQPLSMAGQGNGTAFSQYPTLQVDGSGNMTSSYTQSTVYVASSFTTGSSSIPLGDVAVQMEYSAAITNPTINEGTYIYSNGSGQPGSLLATCNNIKYGNLTGSFTYNYFGACGNYTLAANTTYWVVLKQASAPTGGNVVFASGTTASSVATSPDGSTWTVGGTGPIGIMVWGQTSPSITCVNPESNCLSITATNQPGVSVISTQAVGVYSSSANNNGVQGVSTYGTGVQGTSTSGAGVSANSTNSSALSATSTSNVGGTFSGATTLGDVYLTHGSIRATESASAPTAAANIDFIWANSADHVPSMNNNAGTTVNLMQRFTTNSSYTNATTTFSNVTTLAFPVSASRQYTATCYITWQGSASTAGPKYQWTGPASPTAVVASMWSNVTSSTYTTATATAFSSALANAGTVTATTNFTDILTFSLINGTTAGTVQLQAAADGTGTLTIANGSYCTVQ